MTQRIYRILFVLFVVAGSIRVSAQTATSSDAGVWIIGTKLAETREFDGEADVTLDFDEENGYGLSLNHFWTENLSSELSLQKFKADAILEVPVITLLPTEPFKVNVGEISITAITAMAQWHFNRAGLIAPYVGGGIAHMSGDFKVTNDPDIDSFDLDSEFSWAASAGANVRLSDRIALVGEVKYIPWSAFAEDDEGGASVDVNPLIYGVGLKARF